jgi:hypothetical protein
MFYVAFWLRLWWVSFDKKQFVLGPLYRRNFIVPVLIKSEFALQLYTIINNNKCTSVLNVILFHVTTDMFRPIMWPLLGWYWLTPRSRVLEKLTGYQLAKKFPAFYGIQRFINTFTIARHLSLSWARLIQSNPPFHFLNTHLNIILSQMNPVCYRIPFLKYPF